METRCEVTERVFIANHGVFKDTHSLRHVSINKTCTMIPSVCKASTGVCCAKSFDVGSSLKAEGMKEFIKHVQLHVKINKMEDADLLFWFFPLCMQWTKMNGNELVF